VCTCIVPWSQLMIMAISYFVAQEVLVPSPASSMLMEIQVVKIKGKKVSAQRCRLAPPNNGRDVRLIHCSDRERKYFENIQKWAIDRMQAEADRLTSLGQSRHLDVKQRHWVKARGRLIALWLPLAKEWAHSPSRSAHTEM
jgi:hypothetical protein